MSRPSTAFVERAEKKVSDVRLEESQMDGKTSPAVVARRIKERSFSCSVSKNTIYSWLDNGYLGVGRSVLPFGSVKRRVSRHTHIRKIRPFVRSISERPSHIDERLSFGHWEMDTVVGTQKGKSTCLLVLTERLTRFELIYKLQSRSARCVTHSLMRLKRSLGDDFSRVVKSLTSDNGVEFANSKGIEALNTTLFYCHPYSSWERGSNENANRIIRRHIPKGQSMVRLSPEKVKSIQDWMNNYPRAVISWQTPKEYFLQELSKEGIDISYFI